MLKISELAMNRKREVTTVCYGKKQKEIAETVEKALEMYFASQT